MIYTLGHKPFYEFWQNCQLNNVFSVLVSIKPSYKYAAYLNDYSYYNNNINLNNDSSVNVLDISFRKGIKKYIDDILIYKKVCFHSWADVLKLEPYFFKDDNLLLDDIKSLVKNKQSVSVAVDLFYWIEGSISYNKYHYNHYTLITGFDDNHSVFYVFDDDLFGYKLHLVSEEKLCTSFLRSNLETPAYLIKVEEDASPYQLCIYEVLENAHYLQENIPNVNTDVLWTSNNKVKTFTEAVEKCVLNANRVVNRQIGNKLLFESLYEQGEIKDKNIVEKYILKENELIEGWTEVKNVIAFCKFSKKNTIDLKKINGLDTMLLEKEYNMWKEFVCEFS